MIHFSRSSVCDVLLYCGQNRNYDQVAALPVFPRQPTYVTLLCYEHGGVQSDETVATYAALHVAKRHFLVRTTEEATCIYQDGN
jgi:hypothetical protein